MPEKIITRDNFIFFISALISGAFCYLLVGPENMSFGIVSIMFTFVIYSSNPDNGDYPYIFMWIVFILIACYIGIFLKLSLAFYLFLFAVSSYYYISYNKDPYSDRAIPYLVIYASLGTTIDSLNYKSGIAFLLGSLISLVVLRVAHHKKVSFSAFKGRFLSRSFYDHPKHVRYSSLVYSILLFLSLFLPDICGFRHAYWSPMTFIILLKPQDNNIIINTRDRFIGIISGSIVVLLIMTKIGLSHKLLDLIFILASAFMLPTFLKMSSKLKTFAITIFILLLLELAGYADGPNYAMPYTRIFETLIGGGLALLGSILLRFLKKISIRFV